MALFSVPDPCFATASSAAGAAIFRGLDVESYEEGWEPRDGECCARMAGRERSVEEVEKVCANQPLRRVGRSPMRVPPALDVLA